MKKSIKEQILNYLKDNRKRFIPKWELERKSRQFGCLSETIGRRLRELNRDNPKVEKDPTKHIAHYRYI